MRRLLAALVGALVVLGTACDPNDPSTWVHAAQVAVYPEQTPEPEIVDHTGVVAPLLGFLYTTNELVGGGPVTINWGPETDEVYSARVPYTPNYYPECLGAARCILFSQVWWANAGGQPDQEGARRVLVAHEFAHVLSLERKETDREYGKAVAQVDEECLADAVASNVLARGGWPPNHTDGYVMHYDCETFWQDAYGESRQAQADSLAADLLHWAVYGRTVEITGPAVATEGAEREFVYKW